MAYTRTWAEVNNLLGSRDADEIDDGSRETHLDLTERFDDIIKGGAAADPWVLKGSGLISRYSWMMGVPGVPSTGTFGFGNFCSANANGAAVTIYMPIVVPKGSTLVGVKFRLKATGAGASAVATVFKNNISAAPGAIGAPATAIVGAAWADYGIGTVSELAGDGDSFFAFVNLANGTGTFGEFMDMEVTLEG